MSEYIEKKFLQLDCGLELGKDLRNQIYADLHADWAVGLMNEYDFWEKNIPRKVKKMWRSRIKVTESVFCELYDDLQDVKKKLHVDFPIDMYIVNQEHINAFAMLSFNNEQPSIIVLNSGLVNALDKKQLLSVIGHEVGHLENQDLQLNRLIDFFYGDAIPYELKRRLKIVQKIQELRADRCGYIACEDIEACISAEFVLRSGVSYNRFGDNFEGFIEQSQKDLEIIKKNKTNLLLDEHPESALRVVALQLFANTDTELDLAEQMEKLIDLVHDFSLTRSEKANLKLYVSAGLMAASIDGKISASEIDAIEMQLARNLLFPNSLVEEFKEKDFKRIFNNCLKKMDADAIKSEASNIVQHMLKVIVADQEINKLELDFVRSIAKEKLFMSDEIFAKNFATILQSYYHPIYKMSSKNEETTDFPF